MNQQPSAQHCFVCGVENPAGLQIRFFETEAEPVEVRAEYTVPQRYQGYPGVVHGGILATMLDEVASRAVFRGDPPRMVVTAKLTVRYRKPVPVETPLLLSGRIVEDKGRVVQVAGEIRDTGGVLYAEADVTLMEVDPLAVGTTTVTAENWKVYPPSQD